MSHKSMLAAALLCGATLAISAMAAQPVKSRIQNKPKIGDIVWQEKDFRGYSPLASAVRKNGVLTITAGQVPDSKSNKAISRDVWGNDSHAAAKTNYVIERGLMEFMKPVIGYQLEVEFEIKADVPVPKIPWVGARFSINYATDTGCYNESLNDLSGKYDWKKVSYLIRIPTDIRDCSITLGIIGKQGTVSYRNLKIKVKDYPRSAYFGTVKTPMYKGHNLGRLRGFNSQWFSLRYAHTRSLVKRWNCNVLTGSFSPDKKIRKGKELDAMLQEKVYNLFDKAEANAADCGIYYIIQMADSFHDNGPKHSDLFYTNPAYADYFVEIWKRVAEHYKGRKYIYGFQLINESCFRIPKQPGCPDYEELMERAAKEINKIDPTRTIIVQPEEWYSFRAFEKMRPINAKNVVYAPHFYSPFSFSHQGVGNDRHVKYPSKTEDRYWDKETLRKVMKSARDFQLQYNVHMIVTEFSAMAAADAQSRAQWTKDTIELFEEFGWDWTWHCINEWYGWLPDHVLSPSYTVKDWSKKSSYKQMKTTPTADVICSFTAKNKFLTKVPLKKLEEYQPPVTPAARRVVMNEKIPVSNIHPTGYIHGARMTFTASKGCMRANWLPKDKPTDYLTYYCPATADWKDHTMEFTVNSDGNAVVVLESNYYGKVKTWSCYKDLVVKLNGKVITPRWYSMGQNIKADGKVYYAVSQGKHVHFGWKYKKGDKVEVSFKFKAAGKTENGR